MTIESRDPILGGEGGLRYTPVLQRFLVERIKLDVVVQARCDVSTPSPGTGSYGTTVCHSATTCTRLT